MAKKDRLPYFATPSDTAMTLLALDDETLAHVTRATFEHILNDAKPPEELSKLERTLVEAWTDCAFKREENYRDRMEQRKAKKEQLRRDAEIQRAKDSITIQGQAYAKSVSLKDLERR